MDVLEVGILMVAGVVGGGLNAVAGGGTFITFPVLMAMGLDPITAGVGKTWGSSSMVSPMLR